MTQTEREDMASLVKRIPCELAVLTFDTKTGTTAWLGCNECARCTLLRYLHSTLEELRAPLHNELLKRPENGGYLLHEKLR